MTTFTTEDRLQFEEEYRIQNQYNDWQVKWGKNWVDAVKGGWQIQKNIEYFWPLTEQIGLDLDYNGCAKQNTLSYSIGPSIIGGTGLTWATVPSNLSSSQLTIEPQNADGYLQIGGINLGMEKKPNLFRRVVFKLLGFDWKQK